MIKNSKKLSDPLEEKILSPVFKNLNYNHHSPTSAEMLDGPFIYQKLFLTQEQRRLLEGNANMMAGVCVNDALQWHYSDVIWKMNPLTKKLQQQKNEKLRHKLRKRVWQTKFNEACNKLYNKYKKDFEDAVIKGNMRTKDVLNLLKIMVAPMRFCKTRLAI